MLYKILVGSGGFGRVTLEHAMKQYECFFVDDGYKIGTEICGTQVVGHIDDLEILFEEYKKLLVFKRYFITNSKFLWYLFCKSEE